MTTDGGAVRTELVVGTRMPPRRHTVDQLDLIRYAGAAGDFNRLHWDQEYAATASPTNGVIVHGMLNLALLLRAVGGLGRRRRPAGVHLGQPAGALPGRVHRDVRGRGARGRRGGRHGRARRRRGAARRGAGARCAALARHRPDHTLTTSHTERGRHTCCSMCADRTGCVTPRRDAVKGRTGWGRSAPRRVRGDRRSGRRRGTRGGRRASPPSDRARRRRC